MSKVLCLRFKKPDGGYVYFIGADTEAMRRDAPVFSGNPDSYEIMDLDRVEAEWPKGRDKGIFLNGRKAALAGAPSYYLYG